MVHAASWRWTIRSPTTCRPRSACGSAKAGRSRWWNWPHIRRAATAAAGPAWIDDPAAPPHSAEQLYASLAGYQLTADIAANGSTALRPSRCLGQALARQAGTWITSISSHPSRGTIGPVATSPSRRRSESNIAASHDSDLRPTPRPGLEPWLRRSLFPRQRSTHIAWRLSAAGPPPTVGALQADGVDEAAESNRRSRHDAPLLASDARMAFSQAPAAGPHRASSRAPKQALGWYVLGRGPRNSGARRRGTHLRASIGTTEGRPRGRPLEHGNDGAGHLAPSAVAESPLARPRTE